MIELPFKTIPYGEEKEKYQKRLEILKNEKDMDENEIRNILRKKLESTGLLIREERNFSSYNSCPFDLVAGDEETFDIIGFEIKSDKDTFSRLKHQIDNYLIACNSVYLVVHKKNPPEWLPNYIGVIRIFRDNKIFIENYSSTLNMFGISTDYEWDALFKANDLGKTSKRTNEILSILDRTRKNILFNRFFATWDDFSNKKFKKFYPFTEEEKTILIGFDVPYHYRKLKRDIKELEKRLTNLKEIVSLGEKGIKK